jgi:hypothetical protein
MGMLGSAMADLEDDLAGAGREAQVGYDCCHRGPMHLPLLVGRHSGTAWVVRQDLRLLAGAGQAPAPRDSALPRLTEASGGVELTHPYPVCV